MLCGLEEPSAEETSCCDKLDEVAAIVCAAPGNGIQAHVVVAFIPESLRGTNLDG